MVPESGTLPFYFCVILTMRVKNHGVLYWRCCKVVDVITIFLILAERPIKTASSGLLQQPDLLVFIHFNPIRALIY